MVISFLTLFSSPVQAVGVLIQYVSLKVYEQIYNLLFLMQTMSFKN